MTELSTWGLTSWFLLILNFTCSLAALIVLGRRRALMRLSALWGFLGYSCASAVGVPLFAALTGMGRADYRTACSVVDAGANLILCAVAWQLTKTILPSLRWFAGLWASAIVAVLVMWLAGHPQWGDIGTYWRGFLMASYAAGAILAVCAMMPWRFWSKEYALVGLGLGWLIVSGAVLALVQAVNYSVPWVSHWFPLIRALVPACTLVFYALILWAGLCPVVPEDQHLGGVR